MPGAGRADDPLAELPPRVVPDFVQGLVANQGWGLSGNGWVAPPGQQFELLIPIEAHRGGAPTDITYQLDRLDTNGRVTSTIASDRLAFTGPGDPRPAWVLPEESPALYTVTVVDGEGRLWRDNIYAVEPVTAAVLAVEPTRTAPGEPVSLILENQGTTRLSYGSRWEIHRWTGEQWQPVPHSELFGRRQIVWTLEERVLDPGDHSIEGSLPPVPAPGRYRVVKSVRSASTSDQLDLEAEFVVLDS